MSTLLEQAIIDAAALKETAMKNAENALIEKYNKEFQNNFKKLLEQEESGEESPPPEMDPNTAAANAEDPTGPTLEDDSQMMDLGGLGAPAQTDTASKVFEKVKSAFFDLDGDDDEMVTINFDGLEAKPVDDSSSMLASPTGMQTSLTPPPPAPTPDVGAEQPMMEGLDEEIEIELDEAYDMNGGNSSYGGHSAGVDTLEEDEELEEEIELEEGEELEEQGSLKSSTPTIDPTSAKDRAEAARLEKQAAEKKAAAGLKDAAAQEKAAQNSLEEEVELTEEELNELEEAMKVDMTNVPEGYMGSHKKKAREMKAIAYAEARDDEKAKRREEYAKKVADLQESLKEERKKANDFSKMNNDLLHTVKNLKEHIEKMNVSNAKLLYTNKVLSDVSLNERQKNHVVENISRSQTVLEAKTIYETLQSTVQSVKEKSAPKSLSEVLNRGPSPFIARSNKEPEVMSDRLRLLAGIKKSD